MNGNKTIHLLGLFTFNEGTVHVPEELVDDEHPLQYEPFDHIDYVRSEEGQGAENPIKVYCGVNWHLLPQRILLFSMSDMHSLKQLTNGYS